jgi:hypothetical protein
MRTSIALSVAAALIVAGIASSGSALAKGSGGGHSHSVSGPSLRSAAIKPAQYKLTKVPVPPKDNHYKYRRVIRIGGPYVTTPTCVQVYPSGRRVRVPCDLEAGYVAW